MEDNELVGILGRVRISPFAGFHPGPDNEGNYQNTVTTHEETVQQYGDSLTNGALSPFEEPSEPVEELQSATVTLDTNELISDLNMQYGFDPVEEDEIEEEEASEVPMPSPEELLAPEQPLQEEIIESQPELTPTDNLDNVEVANPAIERNAHVIVRDETLRFSSAEWFAKVQEQVIILAGVGGIGSWVSFLLAKLRPKAMYMYDPDRVELVNMAGQLYSINDVGKYKVDALADTIRTYTGYGDIFCYPTRIEQDSLSGDVMICGFDNMTARHVFFLNWKNHVLATPVENRSKCLFIDGRLAAEELQVLCIQGDDPYSMDQYQKRFLFGDNEAEHELCSFKQTAFVANMIASLIVNLFVNFCANLCNPAIPRTLPFFTQYQADMMFLSMEK